MFWCIRKLCSKFLKRERKRAVKRMGERFIAELRKGGVASSPTFHMQTNWEFATDQANVIERFKVKCYKMYCQLAKVQ